jgi:hypothetical protein
MGKKRDEFPPAVKRTVAERAGYLCSVPNCNRPTIGPHSDPLKAKSLGKAAHICAAAEGGPRYDKDQTPKQRKSIANAIWACAIHADEIDKDDSPYPKETLLEWKRIHEEFLRSIVKLGFREALGLKSIVHQEQHLAATLLAFFSDKRVLHDLLEYEVPRYYLHSVQEIRRRITELRPEARDFANLDERMLAMVQACHTFVREAGPLDSEEPLFRPGNEANVQRIVAALSALRKVFGVHIIQLSALYGLKVDDHMKTLVPADTAE